VNSFFERTINQKRAIVFIAAGVFGTLTSLIVYHAQLSFFSIWEYLYPAIIGLFTFEMVYRARRWLNYLTIPLFAICITMVSQLLYFTFYRIEYSHFQLDLLSYKESLQALFSDFPDNVYFYLETLIVTGFAYWLVEFSAELQLFTQLSNKVETTANAFGAWFDGRPVLGPLFGFVKVLIVPGVILQDIPVIGPLIALPVTIFFLVLPILFEVLIFWVGILMIPINILSTGQIQPEPKFLPGGSTVIWLRYLEKDLNLRALMPIPFIKIPWIWLAWFIVSVSRITYAPITWIFWWIAQWKQREAR